MSLDQFINNPWFVPLMIWSIIWKGFALWKAGTTRDKGWFIALVAINTFGVLDIFYYFVFSKRVRKEPGTANLPPKE